MGQSHIEVIARAVIRVGPKVLFGSADRVVVVLPARRARRVRRANDASVAALVSPNSGVTDVEVGDLLAVTETRYADARGDHHEVNLVFDVTAAEVEGRSREAHLQFRWADQSELEDLQIRPAPVAELVRARLAGPRVPVLGEGFEGPSG